jgi:hypothetical protein
MKTGKFDGIIGKIINVFYVSSVYTLHLGTSLPFFDFSDFVLSFPVSLARSVWLSIAARHVLLLFSLCFSIWCLFLVS